MSFPTLPKWSLIVVEGDDVGPILGSEIVLRTGHLANTWARSEYRARLRVLLDLERFDDIGRVETDLGNLGLQQLGNEYVAPLQRPHGWCTWNGKVGCHDYNVGPDATIRSIETEWRRTAQTWPQLRLCCRLYDREMGLCDPVPLVEFYVSDGVVGVQTEGIVPLQLPETPAQTMRRVVLEDAVPREMQEQTCSVDTFYWALVNLRHKVGWQ